jgi:hypothetical protein
VRRLLAAASITLAITLGFAVGPAAPASAAKRGNIVVVSGSAFIKDDDNINDNSGTHRLDPQRLILPTDGFIHWLPCQGGEVVADVEVTAKAIDAKPGWVRVHVNLWLWEQGSCHRWDVDGKESKDVDVAPGDQVDLNIRQHNPGRGDDKAIVDLKIFNMVV